MRVCALARDYAAATPSTWRFGDGINLQDKKKRRGERSVRDCSGAGGRARADDRRRFTARERSILQAEAGFLTVELRKLKEAQLERAAARRRRQQKTRSTWMKKSIAL